MITRGDLQKRFTPHPEHGDQVTRKTDIRQAGFALANAILERTLESREQSLALGKVEEAVFWAIEAVSRNEHK